MKDTGKLMSMLAFLALIISALIWAVLFVLNILDNGANLGWLEVIANIFVTVVVVWMGWQYAKGLNKVWKIIYLVVAIIALFGSLGVNLLPNN